MAWDESKHPRDGDGRFSENPHERDEKKRDAVRHIYDSDGGLFRMPLDFFGGKKDYSNEPIPEMPKEVFGFAEKERKNTAHHIKHRIKMGYKDQDVYEAAGVEFWKKGKGKIYYSLKRKVFIRYDEKTLKSCYVSCDGFLKTYFLFRSKKEAEQYMKQDFWKEIK